LSSAASKNSGTNRPCRIKDQSGRTFIVTGANSGLGFETARQLAAHGGRVVLATRSERKGVDAVAQLKTAPPDADVEFRALDLADLDSGRAFSAAILSDGIAVEVLLNNAGVMYPPRRRTSQGFRFQFASNHLDHFALTRMLFDTIRRGRDARVVTVSSAEHQGGSIHFDNLTGERPYSPRAFDQQSKFANVLLGPLGARPPRVLEREPPEQRSDRPDEAADEGQQPTHRAEIRNGGARRALRSRRPEGRERPVLRPGRLR
jgi:hypothetical protein